VTDTTDALSAPPIPETPSGPTVSFAFNLAKIPDHGEDSDPILRDGPDLGLIAVFDGMGGAGGTVYETPDGPRTGAYLASRIARDVVERRMLDLLEPDWNLNGEAAARDLHRSIQQALQERLQELKAPKSRLRSRLLRALPTTMALVALQRTRRNGTIWACHVLWAGDSRAYSFDADGARQLSTDDLRDSGDAMANLTRDSVVSNAISADTDFYVNYRRVELQAPFLLACATDGCFGYLPTPMHFEHLVLSPLPGVRSVEAWSEATQATIAAVTGDDAALAVMGVGADFGDFKTMFAPRVDQLQRQFITPIDELAGAVARAEQELEATRQRQRDITARMWDDYKHGYERFLHPQRVAAAETQEPVLGPIEGQVDVSNSVHDETGSAAAEAADDSGATPLEQVGLGRDSDADWRPAPGNDSDVTAPEDRGDLT
jgi:serine/threonine protein phosphatase PrpC